MVVETATVWALSALLLTMIIVAVYFMIFFFIFWVITWGITLFLRPIFRIMNYDGHFN